MRAAYWRDPGALGRSATSTLAPDATDLRAAEDPVAALEAVVGGQADIAVVPLEDATNGMRRDVVDQLIFVGEGLVVVGSVELGEPAWRWVGVVRGPVEPPADAARTLVFVVPAADRPGTLTQLLAAFTTRGINLSRLETRPLGQLGMYGFLIEIDDVVTRPHVRDALDDVLAEAQVVKVLGTVPVSPGTTFGAVAGRPVVGPVLGAGDAQEDDGDHVVTVVERPLADVGIVGLGLIGGSLALDLLATGSRVVGTDPDARTRRHAAAAGVDVVEPASLVGRCPLVVVATPIGLVVEQARGLLEADADVVVTDVASVKSEVVRALADTPRFVGGHPMAGTERSGFDAARPGLLAGAPWLLTPADDVATSALATVLDLALAVGARPTVVTAGTHDRLVAAVSHAPHLLAFALQSLAERDRDLDLTAMAGPSFRDATRVAASDPAFWSDLLARNHDAVETVVAELQAWLADTVDAAAADGLTERLSSARRDPARTSAVATATVVLGVDGVGLDALRLAGAAGRFVHDVMRVPEGLRLTLGP